VIDVTSPKISDQETNVTTAGSVSSHTPGEHRNHLARFKRYLKRNIGYVQHLVEGSESDFSEEVCKQALHTLSYAIGQRELWSQVRTLLLALAPKMELTGHREDWLPYLHRGLAESQQMADQATAAECEFQIGLIYRLLSDFVLAREHLQASISLAAHGKHSRIEARVLNELAWLDHLQHLYQDAEIRSNRALDLLADDDVERAMSYRVQGMIANDLGNWSQAETLHRKALTVFLAHGDQRRAAWSVQNLAYSLHGQQKFDSAIQYYQEALSTLQELGDLHNVAVVQFNLGITYYHSGKIDNAIDCHTAAVEVFQQFNNRLFMARIHTDLGLAYLKQEQFGAAKDAFQTSVNLFNELGDAAWSLNAMDGLAMVYIDSQHYQEAEKILHEIMESLPSIADAPNYPYLLQSVVHHLEECRRGQTH